MVRLRVKYEKTGAIRFTSHKDTMRVFRRGLASGGVPMCYSQGFNPHPRLSFGPSLRTGWEGFGECMDMLLTKPVSNLKDLCNPFLPEGLRIVETAIVAESVPKLSADVTAVSFEVTIDERNLDPANKTWLEFMKQAGATEPASTGATAALLRALESGIRDRFTGMGNKDNGMGTNEGPTLLEIHINRKTGEFSIEYLTTMHQGKSLVPEELIAPFLGDSSELPVPIRVVRKELYVCRGGTYHSPISEGVVQKQL